MTAPNPHCRISRVRVHRGVLEDFGGDAMVFSLLRLPFHRARFDDPTGDLIVTFLPVRP